jgi:SSS family solute:Na+ symporter
VLDAVKKENPAFIRNTSCGRDWLNIAVGMVWQLCMCILPMYLVMKNWNALGITVLILAVTSVFLKFNWFNKLDTKTYGEEAHPEKTA